MAIFPDWLNQLFTNNPPQEAEVVVLDSKEQELYIQKTLDAYAGVNTVEGTVVQTLEVEAHVQYWVIAPDNIYIVNQSKELEPWFATLLNAEIEGSSLADEVSDLDTLFSNYADGTTLQIGYLQTADAQLAYDLNVLKVSNDSNTAVINSLNTTYTTPIKATAIASATIAAWQTDGTGGAWFDSQISVVSNVAYSAAKSASTLTASIDSQSDQLLAIAGDVEILQKQVDGVVETWFDTHDIVEVNGDISLAAEPYATWVIEGTRDIHSGDSYVKYELDAYGNKIYISSWRFALTAVDVPYTDADGYAWVAVSDSRAEEAYQAALLAQSTADGKITTYYQTYPPTIAEFPELSLGDLWLDSDDNNKLWRYNPDVVCPDTSVVGWCPVDDTRISASVTRLDEATVSVDNLNPLWTDDGIQTDPDIYGEPRFVPIATAKSTLVVDANGSIVGYVASSDGSTSTFKIFADNFIIANSEGSEIGNPFEIDTLLNKIRFNGVVSFDNIDGDTDFVEFIDLATPAETTVIDGANIRTGLVVADRIDAATLSAISADLGTVNAGVMYNTGGTAASYTMKIDLTNGEIHIK